MPGFPPPETCCLTCKYNDFKCVINNDLKQVTKFGAAQPAHIPLFLAKASCSPIMSIRPQNNLCDFCRWTRKEPLLPHADHFSTEPRIPIVCSTPLSRPAEP